MYTRQELSKLKQDFWTRFGQYMLPIASATGDKVNWVNYKTGVTNIRFVMDADNKQATIAIVLSHSDAETRNKYYALLQNMKAMLTETLGEEWNWNENDVDEYGKVTSTIGTSLPGISIASQNDWPAIISFLKQRILALDAFWGDARFVFEML
jgi:hypothetical protein